MSMNGSPFSRPRSLRAASVAAVAALTLLVPTFAAQDDDGPHPAHIHSGTCETLGDVVVPLTDVAPRVSDAGPSGPATALPVKISSTLVDMPLQDIIDGGHAINVHESAETIDVYIACGDIGGIVGEQQDGDAELVIGLRALNDSGHTGVAWLGSDGDSTIVDVYLLEPGEMIAGEAAAQAASPAADAATESVAVEIKDFAFNPIEITVPAGGSIAWTNQDNAPHTATANDREVLQSGAIAFGESFTQAFDTPGTYEYFCEFHPNMNGTIVVE
jgi:plastocyanin